MRILYVTSSLRASDGVATFLTNYLTHMNLSNSMVTIACSTKNISTIKQESLIKSGIKIVDISHPTEIGILNFIKRVQTFLKNNHDFDIIHCNTIATGFIFLREAKKYGIKVRILHSHATQNSESFIHNLRNNLLKWICMHYANEYVACSKLAGDYLFGKKKYTLVYNAIDYDIFKYDNECNLNLRQELQISKNDVVIGFIGRICRQKNPLFLIDVFNLIREKSNNYHLVILGDGPLVEDLKIKIKDSAYQKDIHFLGTTTTPEKYYSLIDVFLLPSLFEGLPLVGIEAQAASCYFLCSDNVTKEVKISNNIKFLPITNLNLWSDTILNLTINRNAKLELSSNYNISNSAKELMSLYTRMEKKYE